MHFAEQGEGPLVLLCHGFPEGWYSWRDQLAALAAAGYRAVAPDMRGYGRTDAPPDISSYGIMDIVGDMVGLVGALGARQTIDMLGVLAEKTKGNLNELEDRTLQTALFDVRMAFLELTNMISMQGVPPPPSPTKR